MKKDREEIITKEKTLNEIYDYVTENLGVINTRVRKPELVFARSLFYKLAKENTVSSLADIGSFVNRDHATVLHGLKLWDNEVSGMYRYKTLYNNYKKTQDSPEYDIPINEVTKIEVVEKEVEANLEPHEVKYRQLPEDKKEKFRLRVEAILKMI